MFFSNQLSHKHICTLDNKDNLPLIGLPWVERDNFTILTERQTVIENKTKKIQLNPMTKMKSNDTDRNQSL